MDPGIDAAHAGALIAERFPELAALPLVPLGTGTGHAAFGVGGRVVVRFALDREAAGALEREAALTAVLAPLLDLAVPAFRWLAPAAHGDTPAMGGYPRLPGVPAITWNGPLSTRACGVPVGGALRVLHGLDTARFARMDVPRDLDPTLADWREEAFEELDLVGSAGAVTDDEAARLERLLAAPVSAAGVTARLLHGDLAAEHVLLDPAGVPAGIIDWSDACLGDPARDLGGLLHWGGEPLLDAALTAYGPVPPGTRERARWYAACRAVADIRFGHERGLPAYAAAGRTALAHLR
ncbi:MAG: phosphotransferase [Thermoleophilia bacterium]|nr:phosphotransferase [Thermoleophilia bacterium]